jgi:hypothetical protein
MADLKVGDRVRVIGQEPIGTVMKIGMSVSVKYVYRKGTETWGYYPASHLALVEEPEGINTAPAGEGDGAAAPAPATLSKKSAKSGGGAATASPPPVS